MFARRAGSTDTALEVGVLMRWGVCCMCGVLGSVAEVMVGVGEENGGPTCWLP